MNPRLEDQLAELWLTEYEPVRSRVQRAVKNRETAEDITMQAFAQLTDDVNRGTGKPEAALLQTIADRRVVDYIRSEVRKPDIISFDELKAREDQANYRPYIDPEFTAGFDHAVRDLPEDERDAFILTELRGLTVREAADILGTSKSDVDRKAGVARLTIREELLAHAA